MNIGKKVKKIVVRDREFIMTFDMESVRAFKELTGKSYLQSSSELGRFDDELMLGFMGATLRDPETPEAPIMGEVYKLDVLYLLNEHCWDVIDLVTTAMPQESKPRTRPRKKKKKKRR